MKAIYTHSPKDGTNPRLTKGREYFVVGLDNEHYRIVNDANEPILYPKECFIANEREVPKDWVKRDYPDGEYHIDPPECAYPGFYEEFFDGNNQIRQQFKDVLMRIKTEYH